MEAILRRRSKKLLSKPQSIEVIHVKRKVTHRGVALCGGSLVMLMAGFLLRSGELMTLGGCGLLMVVACFVLAPLNLRGLKLRVQLPPRFFATRSVTALVELCNPRRALNAWSVEIIMRFPHQLVRSGYAAWTPTQSSSVLSERLSLPARVEATKVDYEFRSRFPLGLFEVHQVSSSSCPVLVYPRLITPVELQVGGSQSDLNPIVGVGLGDLFGEPRGIRRYQPGDKATRIHQSASAHSISRGQGLQVRAFDPPGLHPHRCRIVFHSFAKAGDVIRLDRFERALSLATGTLAHFYSNQTKVSFQADFTNWRCCPCENRAQYFECLALLARAKRAPQTTAHELAEILQKAPSDERLIIISDASLENWSDLVPLTHRQVTLINIREVRFKPRKVQLQLVPSS